MTAEEKEQLLATYHPDYKQDEFTVLQVGPNKGEKVPTQLAELLQAKSRVSGLTVDLEHPDYETDVLVIGGGGAGASAAIEADNAGAAKNELLYQLATEAPEAILWLNELGVEFDKAEDGTMITTHGGGTSRKRMHAAKDYSGAEIMRTLRDEVLNR